MRTDVSIRSVAPACGAEIRGVDLRRATAGAPDAGDDDLRVVRDALRRHAVVFVRDQPLDLDEQVALTARLGRVLRVPYIQHLPSHPDVIAVLKEADERRISTFGGSWHSDFSFLDEPPSFTLLHAKELPEVGGDTLWASQEAAYDALSPGMQRLLAPLRAVQTGWPHGTNGPGPNAAVSRSVVMTRNDPSADREVLHPVVRVHPDTGRRSLFVNPVYTQRFEDTTVEESRPLLQYVFDHAVRAEFTCRLRWEPDTLAIWDNRCLLHLAINDSDGSRRLLHRTTVAGERPVGADQR
ncbi:MAG: TauD/TfdA dioxygenase family protein [Actinomycetes bacterium]